MTASATASPKMQTQSRQRVCVGCARQITGKIRKQRCENCYRSNLKRERARGLSPASIHKRVQWDSAGQAALASVQRASNGCWLFTGSLDSDGYGRTIEIKGFPRTLPHRAVYEWLVGPIPPGMQLDHTCHDAKACSGGVTCLHRRCVNPDHLKPETPRANTMRSNSVTAFNAHKTHCIHGHEFTPENTYVQLRRGGSKSRQCRTCIRNRREARRNR